MPLNTRPLDGPFGVEVQGVDLNDDIAQDVVVALDAALLQHQVLLFRKQELDDPQLAKVASLFGEVRALPGGFRGKETVSGVRHLTNLGRDGKPTGVHPQHWSKVWHTDGGYSRPPARATLLYCVRASGEGGLIQFADMYAGLEAFTPAERARLETLDAIHDQDLARVLRHARTAIERPLVDRWKLLKRWARFLVKMISQNVTVHPLVYFNAAINRSALLLGSDVWRIRGMGWVRGMREVEELTRRAIRQEIILTCTPCPGDVLLWDNRSLLHRVDDYDTSNDARVTRQVVILPR